MKGLRVVLAMMDGMGDGELGHEEEEQSESEQDRVARAHRRLVLVLQMEVERRELTGQGLDNVRGELVAIELEKT